MCYRITIRTVVLFQLQRTGLRWRKTYRFAVFLKARSAMFYHHVTASSLDPTTMGTISCSRLCRRPWETAEAWLTRRLFRSRWRGRRCRSGRIVRCSGYWRSCHYGVWSLTIHPYLGSAGLNRRRGTSCRGAAWLTCQGLLLLCLPRFSPLIGLVNPARVARRANRSWSRQNGGGNLLREGG